MKLAKYEVPPPGFFNNFSTKVINRIESQGSNVRSGEDQIAWLRRLLNLLETNALAAGAFGFTVCGLLIAGIAWSEYQEPMLANANDVNGTDVASSGVNSENTTTLASIGSSTASLSPSLSPSLVTNMPDNVFNDYNSLNVRQVDYNPAH